MKRVYLSETEKKLAGVCGGFAETLNIDPTLIRLLLIAILLSPMASTALVFYLLCWMIIPKDPGYNK